MYKKKQGKAEDQGKARVSESNNVYKLLAVLAEHRDKELTVDKIFDLIDKDPRWLAKKDQIKWVNKKKHDHGFTKELDNIEFGVSEILRNKGLGDELSKKIIVKKGGMHPTIFYNCKETAKSLEKAKKAKKSMDN